MNPAAQPITLLELNSRVSRALASSPGLNNVWVVAETSDVRVSGGHCYMELIDKDPNTGGAVARARATIWRSTFERINARFMAATGMAISSNIKIMVQCSVSFHPIYGLSVNIGDVDPDYTVGDLMRRRREMLNRLKEQGIIDLNRQLQWPAVPWRVAVISAQGAAGYGDFINQLYSNSRRLRFRTRLFEARMQGELAPASIIAALEAVAQSDDDFDCVVIIRGGGATGDLAAFDHYELAANIAMFPLPVVIGIGHERDITLLDYVANTRVKTPTAAAELLIARVGQALDAVMTLGNDILAAATARVNASHRRLEYIAGQLPELARGVLHRASMKVGQQVADQLAQSVATQLRRRADRLEALGAIIDTLSPEATLRRGFSITRVGTHAVTDASGIAAGTEIITTLASGELISITK